MIQAVLFDLDGTITDSFEGIANSFRHALAAVGAPEPAPEVVRGIAGPPMIDSLHALGLSLKDAPPGFDPASVQGYDPETGTWTDEGGEDYAETEQL